MAADHRLSSSCLFSGPTLCSNGVQPLSDPQSEMETLRRMVSERLTAAVEEILTVFGRTVSRYREQIDLQQRQLDGLKTEEGRWGSAAGG